MQVVDSVEHFPRLFGSNTEATTLPAAREVCVRRFGSNSSSYALLEGPKRYFESELADGFVAYQMRAGVAVIGGDPVCDPQEASALLREFTKQVGSRPVCAYQVMGESLPAYRAAGFDHIQIGTEALFNLPQFTLAGGKMELVRAATNKARREGVVVTEFFPFAPNASELTTELRAVSAEWIRAKGGREMGFLLGGLSLDQPSAKRYFVARSGRGQGRVEGFIVCAPIYGRCGYYLDVTRRRTDAIRGTMELLTTEIFRQLKEEGFAVASMGLAPLARLDDPDLSRHPLVAKVMRFAYEHTHRIYDFKHLHRYKAKFHPDAWEPRYLCFRPRLSPRVLYAAVQVRDAFTWRELFGHSTATEAPAFGRTGAAQSARWKRAASLVAGLGSSFWISR
jgi:phosphatidylglycerol lysyltransferase